MDFAEFVSSKTKYKVSLPEVFVFKQFFIKLLLLLFGTLSFHFLLDFAVDLFDDCFLEVVDHQFVDIDLSLVLKVLE